MDRISHTALHRRLTEDINRATQVLVGQAKIDGGAKWLDDGSPAVAQGEIG